MRSNAIVVLAVAVLAVGLLAVSSSATAQTQSTDLTGTWTMSATVDLPAEMPGAGTGMVEKVAVPEQCHYEGRADIVDTDGDLSGTVDLILISGPQDCPAEMSGMLTGGTDPGTTDISVGGTISGQLGALNFSGTLTPNPGGGGTFMVTQGGFTNASGTWAARLLQSVLEIPTLTAVGLTVMTLLLLAGGYFVLRHTVA